MKTPILWCLALLWLTSCSDTITKEELKRFAAIESFPEDDYLKSVASKRAMVIVAHDDDDCAMSGTIAQLTAQGWEIQQLSFKVHPSQQKGIKYPAQLICKGNKPIVADNIYRVGLDSMEMPYLPIPISEFEDAFFTQKIRDSLIAKIYDFKPTILFSLDDIKGGYGHPDHIFISRMLVNLFKTGKIKVDRIYQSVYTDHMESEIVDKRLGDKLKKWNFPNTSDLANELYQIDGMPEPDVEINILATADIKMKYLRAYPEYAKKNMRKFIPYYEDFDAKTYFNIFNREFFRVIK